MSDMIRKSDALAAAQDASDNSDEPQDVVSAIAALPTVMPKVKPLVWVEKTSGTSRFPAWKSDAGLIVDSLNIGQFTCCGRKYDTLDAAKAAAQRDYEARILAALEPAPNPAVTVGADAVLEAAHKYLLEQYGASPLAHPIDRARILAALEPVAAPVQYRDAGPSESAVYDRTGLPPVTVAAPDPAAITADEFDKRSRGYMPAKGTKP